MAFMRLPFEGRCHACGATLASNCGLLDCPYCGIPDVALQPTALARAEPDPPHPAPAAEGSFLSWLRRTDPGLEYSGRYRVHDYQSASHGKGDR